MFFKLNVNSFSYNLAVDWFVRHIIIYKFIFQGSVYVAESLMLSLKYNFSTIRIDLKHLMDVEKTEDSIVSAVTGW